MYNFWIQNNKKKIIFCGDFNLHFLTYENSKYSFATNKLDNITDLLNEIRLKITIYTTEQNKGYHNNSNEKPLGTNKGCGYNPEKNQNIDLCVIFDNKFN